MCSFRFSLSVKLLTQNGQLSIFLLDLTLGGDGSFGCSSFFPTLSKTPSSAIMVWLRSSAAAAGPISIFLHVANHTTCCDYFKSSEYGSLLKLNTEAAEQTNSVLRRITTSTTYMSPLPNVISTLPNTVFCFLLPIILYIKSLPMMLFSSLINSVPVKGSHQKKLVSFRNIS